VWPKGGEGSWRSVSNSAPAEVKKCKTGDFDESHSPVNRAGSVRGGDNAGMGVLRNEKGCTRELRQKGS